jgi:tetratricopeptide (TPR) repeat protein
MLRERPPRPPETDRVVFISYRGEDSHSYGALLYRDLTDYFGKDLVFLDAESTPAGADFAEELLGRVRSARLLLAVIGPHWLTATDPATGRRRIDDPADWVRRELAEAFAVGVRVIPVLTDHADLPAAADLPADIAALSRCQYRHLRRREPTADLARIVTDLTGLDPDLAAAARNREGGPRRLSVAPADEHSRLLPRASWNQRTAAVNDRRLVHDAVTARGAREALRQQGRQPGPELRSALDASLRQRPNTRIDGVLPGSRQLPADTAFFTGRGGPLGYLLALAERTRDTPGTAVISAIDGMGGVGKTALAVHAGHLLAERFPDGQLFVDLHGFAQGLSPRAAAEVLADLLRTLGVPPQQIPEDLDARAALYRDRLSGKRMLVILDNARSEEQVRPLLPGHPGCLVLVTSRRRLKALDEAQVLSLDVLPLPDAVALLRTIAGPWRVSADDPGLKEIAHLCGLLPLALRMAAALLRHRPCWSLDHLARRLREARPALAGFRDGDRDLAGVFHLSYAALPDDQQALFRRLGLYPGPDVDPYAAAALLDTDPDTADALLQHLVDHNLLTESPPGRYHMHDLIRAHADTLAASDPEPGLEAALGRLLDYYQHTALRASSLLARVPWPETGGTAPHHAPDLPDQQSAQAWLRVERANLDAAFDHARRQGPPSHVVALATGMAQIMLTDGPWTRALEVLEAGAQAAARLGDRPGQALTLAQLGSVRGLAGDHKGADEALTGSSELYRDLGNRLGQALALGRLGSVRYLCRDYNGAADALTDASQLYRDLDNRHRHALALAELGAVRQLAGDYKGAADALIGASRLYRDLGDRHGQALALEELGAARQLAGDYKGAADALTTASQIYCDLGYRHGQARVLAELGIARRLAGNYAAAIDAHTRASELYRDAGDQLGLADVLTNLGLVRHAAGDLPSATDALSQALATYRDSGISSNEAPALSQLATLFTTSDDRLHALAVSLEGIANHHVAGGDTSQGTALLYQALEIYQGLGMCPDTERIQTRLADLAAP